MLCVCCVTPLCEQDQRLNSGSNGKVLESTVNAGSVLPAFSISSGLPNTQSQYILLCYKYFDEIIRKPVCEN